jgi:hypothetical protein
MAFTLSRNTLPIVIMAIFGAAGALGAGAVAFVLVDFAREAHMSPWLVGAVPALFGMLFALIVYQGADRRVGSIAQSLSRALLVALLTWIGFSLLASWAWCPPTAFFGCFSNALIVSGLIGGGPLLAATLTAGFVAGHLVLRYRRARPIAE